ncbi:MAG: o-succinylbenzoate synthase [Cyanobacteria bacterium Co-bin13]|nr:o-succinylbenzoate synthase [Cyanobacteria bacterium Co-bin13]
MRLWVEYRPYERPFCQPLQTAHGLWSVRQGILLKLTNEAGRSGYGEAAPIPWFGSESLATALDFCQGLGGWQEPRQLQAIPPALPACQSGVGLALTSVEALLDPPKLIPKEICGLLPAGKAALDQWRVLWKQGHRTFKWKVGVEALDLELEQLQALVRDLPPGAQLRLDANGGLGEAEAAQWLKACDALPGKIEFLEQPLPPEQFEALQQLSQRYQTPIALDESVASLTQLENCWRQGWSGVYVIKPAICGYPAELVQFICDRTLDVVLSSALETGVGRRGAMALAQQIQPSRALGFGTGSLFDDDWDSLSAEQLWAAV